MKLLFQISSEDTSYINLLKGVFANSDAQVQINNSTPSTVTEIVMTAKERKCTAVLCSNPKLLALLLGDAVSGTPSLDDYAGSLIERKGMDFLILPPLKQLVTVNYTSFLYSRFLSKVLKPEAWLTLPEFQWEVATPENSAFLLPFFKAADFISCDIETARGPGREITCVGFTAVTLSPLAARTVVIPFTSSFLVALAASIADLPQMKVFQNGKYDNAYLLRYGIPVRNYSGDTLNMLHSWLSELPKDLGFVAAFCLRKWEFWKNEGDTSDLQQYYRYNAKDCYATAMSWIALLLDAPDWAVNNYKKEFPLVFPSLLTEMTGLKRDAAAVEIVYTEVSAELDAELQRLRVMVDNPYYNPSSAPQTLQIFALLGSGDITNTTPPSKDKVSDRHPLNKLIVKAIDSYRKKRKFVGTYLRDEATPKIKKEMQIETKTWKGRLLYSLNPHGTDTGRFASRESAFWCGWQIQNIPEKLKFGIVPDDGFYFGECDYSQNEARGTAYISGDTALIQTVDDVTKDFHGANASRFFGIPYEAIVESKQTETGTWVHKVLDKELRNLSKRTNHGANYNMGAGVMLDTMGIENVRRAKKMLELPENWRLMQVTEHLLAQYSLAYPVVKGAHYDKVIRDVLTTRRLEGPTGWVRMCFGNPQKSKSDLNAYVAHPPQSLGAMQLNLAYLQVFNKIAREHPTDFKLGPQIHDSILFQYRKTHEHLAWEVKAAMEIFNNVKDTFGKTRVLCVPTDLKGRGESWGTVKAMTR